MQIRSWKSFHYYIGLKQMLWILPLILLLTVLTVSGAPYNNNAGKYHEDTACDGYEITLRCPGSDLINIEMATYGRLDDRTCVTDKNLMRNTQCSLSSSKDVVSNKCNGKSSCSFIVSSTTFIDPCTGTSKYLIAQWKCVPFLVVCPGMLTSVLSRERYETNKAMNAAWLRDPFQQTSKVYYMGWSKYETSQVYEYSTADDMLTNQPTTFHHLPHRVDGTGFVVYDSNIFYNKERSRTIVRYDLGTGHVATRADLPNANYHGTSPYAIEMSTDIDMAVDEHGLWAIYATEANDGNIVVSRMERQSLQIIDTWRTRYEKLSALNAFMACGVLYVVNFNSLQIDYMFNTTSNTGREILISIPGLTRTTSAIEYNPKDQKLYVWDNKVAISYEVDFEIITPAPRTTTTSTTTSRTPFTTTTPTTTATTKITSEKTTSTTFVSPKRPEASFCVGKIASGLLWPNTTYTKMAVLNCPGRGAGNAIWLCGGNKTHPEWITRKPDLTSCSSKWIKDLEEELNVGVITVTGLSEKLATELKKNELTSWDIVEAVQLMKRILHESTSNLQRAATITDSILKCSSELLQTVHAVLWKSLAKDMQRQTANSLASVVESAALFLAEDMAQEENRQFRATASPSSRQSGNSVNWSEPYVTLGIRIETGVSAKKTTASLKDNVPSATVTWNSGHGDSVILDNQAVTAELDLNPEQKFAILHMSFKNLGNYIEDSLGFGSENFPVNSHVISLSIKRINNAGEPLNRLSPSQQVHLVRPVILNVQHSNAQFHNHVCAYWNKDQSVNDGYWWRSGCRRVRGNATHSTCECDHLTNFVVLSSNNRFPLMGAEVETPVESNQSDIIIYLGVVRGGMVISVAFLVVVIIILFRFSKVLDLNTIHKNIVTCLLLSEIVFMVGIQQVMHVALCITVAAFLHWGVLCTFTWGALEAYHHLVVFSDPHERNDRWRWYYMLGYGLPSIVVIISASVDYLGYGNNSVCWVKTNGRFIWSFIAPGCFAICLCVAFLALVLCKLNSHYSSRTESSQISRTRKRVARTCFLMFLLCTMWSCAFLWLSGYQPQLTAWLFAILCAVHGVTSFFFYCILPPEVRSILTCFKRKIKRNEGRFAHRSSSGIRLVPNAVRTNNRRDGTTASSDYQYSGTTTTLLPVSTAHAVVPTREERSERSLLATSTTAFLQHDLVTSVFPRTHSDEYPCSSASLSDDTDPKLPSGFFPQFHPSWNEYVHTSDKTTCKGPMCHTNQGSLRCKECTNSFHKRNTCDSKFHHYEQPNIGYCACTTSTSTCYDHLHEDPLFKGSSKSYSCRKCNAQLLANTSRLPQRLPPHHYETLGPFDDDLEQLPDTETLSADGGVRIMGNPPTLTYRHCYEDMQPETVRIEQTNNSLKPHYAGRTLGHTGNIHSNLTIGTSGRACIHAIGQNKSYNCQFLKVDRSGLIASSKSECSYSATRNGRSSDPLSTDQGYDTDSQHPSQMLYRNSIGDCEGVHNLGSSVLTESCVGVDVLSDVNSRGTCGDPPVAIMDDPSIVSTGSSSRVTMTNPELSRRDVDSDCASENDHEVEFINSLPSTSSYATANPCGETKTLSNNTSNSIVSETYDMNCGDNDTMMTSIDTAKGGRTSVSGSVTSWSAHTGSNERRCNAIYHSPGSQGHEANTKSTVGAQTILVQSRQGEIRRSADSAHCVPSDRLTDQSAPSDHHLQYNAYTLPGTTETGTKARIDLRGGGISMITNL